MEIFAIPAKYYIHRQILSSEIPFFSKKFLQSNREKTYCSQPWLEQTGSIRVWKSGRIVSITNKE